MASLRYDSYENINPFVTKPTPQTPKAPPTPTTPRASSQSIHNEARNKLEQKWRTGK
jgi:hypothetical protein